MRSNIIDYERRIYRCSGILKEGRTERKRMEKRNSRYVSACKFSCGLKRKAYTVSEVRRASRAAAFTGEPPVSRAGAPEHEGVGLTPLGSKLATDWLAVYGTQRKNVERGDLGSRSLVRSRSRAKPSQPASQPASNDGTASGDGQTTRDPRFIRRAA